MIRRVSVIVIFLFSGLVFPEALSAEEWLGFPDLTVTVGDHPFSVTTGEFNGDGTFSNAVSYAAGNGPLGMTTGDFNEDGIIDLVTANRDSDSISVFLGNDGGIGLGDGTFGSAVNYAAGDALASVTTGDFNGDGITDVATANQYSDNVSVLLGNDGGFGIGDGTFGAAKNYAAGKGPASVKTGDFNSDGITDLVTGNSYSDNVTVLLGNDGGDGVGDGTFGVPVPYDAGDGVSSIVTGDFNGDGIIDLATANIISNNVSVLLGNDNGMGGGDGTFGAATHLPSGDDPSDIATADFNGDRVIDFAVTNYLSRRVSVLLGNGDGIFGAVVSYPTGDYPISVTIADFNGDGIIDLATANFNSDNISVLLGNEDRIGFGEDAFSAAVHFVAGDNPTSVMTGDFNSDGRTDLAAANRSSDDVSVLLNLGFGLGAEGYQGFMIR